MLTFNNATAVFVALFGLMVIADLSLSVPNWLYVPFICGYLLLLIYGSIFVCSGFYLKAICSAPVAEKIIALTFDDGPDRNLTPQVLEILKEHNAKGNFFCIGRKASDNPELLKQIDNANHIIGSHSYSHSVFFDFYSKGRIADELKKTEDVIHSATGKKVNYFRPPFGVTNPPLSKAVGKMNYKVIGWNIRSLDTLITGSGKVLNRIIPKIKPGAIILLHDNNPRLPDILRKLLRYCDDKGYRCVRLDEMLNDKTYD